MASERWLVRVTVERFGPAHALWTSFVLAAEQRTASESFHWTFTLNGDSPGSVAIRAVVDDEHAETAVKRVMRAVREAGRSVDRYASVPWEQITGAALKR